LGIVHTSFVGCVFRGHAPVAVRLLFHYIPEDGRSRTFLQYLPGGIGVGIGHVQEYRIGRIPQSFAFGQAPGFGPEDALQQRSLQPCQPDSRPQLFPRCPPMGAGCTAVRYLRVALYRAGKGHPLAAPYRLVPVVVPIGAAMGADPVRLLFRLLPAVQPWQRHSGLRQHVHSLLCDNHYIHIIKTCNEYVNIQKCD
jgi:hypothetical protein